MSIPGWPVAVPASAGAVDAAPAAAGVYLSHQVIPTNHLGYGKLLGKCFWHSKRLYTNVITMAKDDDPFIVVPVQRLPAERAGASPGEVKRQLELIDREIVTRRENKDLIAWFHTSPETWELFRELGSDQIIITYSFNFKRSDGSLNPDAALCNTLNEMVFKRLSLHNYDALNFGEVPKTPMFVTQSSFEPGTYGQDFVNDYGRRLGLGEAKGVALNFLISTTQDPWISNTEKGNFIPEVVAVLHGTVTDCVSQLRQDYPSAF